MITETPSLPETMAVTETPLDEGSDGNAAEWADMLAEEDTPAEPVIETEVAEIPPTEVSKPVEPAAAPAVPPVVAQLAETTPTVPPGAPTVPVVPAPQIDVAAEETRLRGELEKAYAFSEEEALAFQTEPELVLPKLAANLHMQITKDVMAGIQSILPSLMTNISAASTAEQTARNQFYSVNPDLANPQFEDAIIQCGKLFRSVNKDAPADRAAILIGNMARQALGLPSLQAVQSTTTASGSVTNPVQPQVTQKIMPFSPSRGGSGAGGVVNQPSEWEQLASDDD